MPVRQVIEQGRVPVKVYTDDVEAGARQQLVNISRLPIVHHHVAAMPDVHAGIGATVGSVIATDRAIIPAAVGVDIGCGMIASRTSLTANDLDEKSLKRVYDQIVRDVPVGLGPRGFVVNDPHFPGFDDQPVDPPGLAQGIHNLHLKEKFAVIDKEELP